MNDEINITKCMKYCDIEFEEDKNRELEKPTKRIMTDFHNPTIRLVYKKMYRSLKFYEGRYLFMIVSFNSRTLNNDLEKTYSFIDKLPYSSDVSLQTETT